MKYSKFLTMVAVSSAIFLQACSVHEEEKKNYVLANGQESAQMVIGEAKYINLYNLKYPISLTVKAPEDKKIYYKSNNTYAKELVLTVNPRDKLAFAFQLEGSDGKKEDIEFRLNSYKMMQSKPENGVPIREMSGKTNKLKGYRLSYILGENQTSTEIDLDGLNHSKYKFNFQGKTDDLNITLLPPKDYFFLFDKGVTQNSYEMKINKDDNKYMIFHIQHKESSQVLSKKLSFDLENTTPSKKLKI